MYKYVAFLRAINVGVGRQVKMDLLRKLFENLGYQHVKSYIQTGNIIFDTEQKDLLLIKSSIEPLLKQTFGFEIPVILRTDKEVSEIIINNPFKDFFSQEKTATYVALLDKTPTRDLITKIEELSNNIDTLKIVNKDIFWLAYKERGKSPITNTLLEKTIKITATTRNLTTMIHLENMCQVNL